MKKPERLRLHLCWVFAFQLIIVTLSAQPDSLWKAGVSRVVITPREPMWMAGYAARESESQGTLHDLWAKALALEDANGNRAVMISTDLLGFPKALSDRIRDRIQKQYGLQRAQVLLNSSHTHSAPVLEGALLDIYPIDAAQMKKIQRYTSALEDQIVELAGRALRNMRPAKVSSENGVTRFQVNRRNNPAPTLATQQDLNGPNDYAVPVIKVADATGSLVAVAFGYACHNTVLSGYDWSGDYAGFAQLELEKMYPGTTALFFQGAGADQNPLPRHTIPLAQQYGRELAAAVDRVLQEPMRRLRPSLSTAYREVSLGVSRIPTTEEYGKMAESFTGYQKQWAERMFREARQGKTAPGAYPFPLQVWRLGDQVIFSLGGELVIGYAIALKRIFGSDAFVFGYSNDVMAYIPTTVILREGGYEGETSQMVYGLPAPWAPDIEPMIMYEMVRLAGELNLLKKD